MKGKMKGKKMMISNPSESKQSVYNFGAGPACLPPEVLTKIKQDIPDWYEGMSIMELSHRLPVIMALTESIEADLRQLLSIPEEFAVLFTHGGARTQFSAIPLNLLNGAPTADYLITGQWSKLAYEDAKNYCQPNCVASSELEGFVKIPDENTWNFSEKGAYFHYTDNETIHGIEFPALPQTHGKWLISDVTSNIVTKPIDFSGYGLLYASAQKNLGIAGITIVIVRKSLLGRAHPFTPFTLNYDNWEKTHSLGNTPPVFNWYVCGLVIKWVLSQGGCQQMASLCEQKSKLFYDRIDQSDFYNNQIYKPHRSRVTIPFRLPTQALDALFVAKAGEQGLHQLKGHKLVGGCRACFYNAMPLAGVTALIEFMNEFEKTYG